MKWIFYLFAAATGFAQSAEASAPVWPSSRCPARRLRSREREHGGCGTGSRRTRQAWSDAAGALPRERHRRQAHGSGRQDLRHSIRGGAAGQLDRRLPATRWRWPEWNRRRADRQSGRRGQARAGARFRRGHQRHGTSEYRRRLRRELHAGPAGRTRFRVRRDRAADGAREADHRRLLWQAARTFLLCRMFDGRPRGDDHVAALSAVLRRHRRGLARDAHGPFEPGDAHGDRGLELGRAQGCERQAGTRAFRQREEGVRREAAG